MSEKRLLIKFEDPDNSLRVKMLEREQTINTTIIGNYIGTVDKYFCHTQIIPSDVWIIYHGLNKKPAIMVVDSADSVVIGEIIYIDNNSVELRFNGAFSGAAYFN